MFVPAHKEDFIKKAKSLRNKNKDLILIYDLEDSVPHNKKALALKNVKKHATIKDWVRINDDDDVYNLHGIVDGMVIPKADPWRMEKYHNYDPLNFIPLIETAAGIEYARELVGEVGAVIFGQYDFTVSMKSELYTPYAVERIAVVCKAFQVPVFNSPTYSLDHNSVALHARASYEFGFDGMCILHPDHIKIVNNYFKPSPADVADAKKVLQHADKGLTVMDNHIIGPPIIERARQIVSD